MKTRELETKVSEVRTEAKSIQDELKNLEWSRLQVVLNEGINSDKFREVSERIRQLKSSMSDLQDLDLTINRFIEQHQEEESKKALQPERERKERIIKFIREHPPKCGYCGKSDKMRMGDWNPDPRLRVRQPVFPGSFDAGMTSKDVRWSLHFECLHRGCPSENLGQRVYPDEERYFADGSKDPEFPVKLKKDEEKTK